MVADPPAAPLVGDRGRQHEDVTELESSEAHLYFLAIEKVFLEERGSPLCLSPKDWHAPPYAA